MFYGCEKLKEIKGINKLNAKIGLNNLFNSCKSLISLDLSNFDPSKETSFESIFYKC